VLALPWDPGHSAAYNVGIGVTQSLGGATFALDAIYEPILTHTWGEAPSAIPTTNGLTIPAGGKTTENHFQFSNAIARLGLGRELPLGAGVNPLLIQGGIAAHAIKYWLTQDDHVNVSSRRQYEQWLEWTPTWGASMRFGGVDVRYLGRTTHGTGRPGVSANNPVIDVGLSSVAGSNILAAPNGPMTLGGVSVTTHQLSISVPLP
jgi:hypothetical protein